MKEKESKFPLRISEVGALLLNVPRLVPAREEIKVGNKVISVLTDEIDLKHPDIETALDNLGKELESPMYKTVLEEIRDGRKKAWYKSGFGILSLIVTSATVIEFGVRHGKDFQKMLDIFEERKKNK